MGTRLVSGGKAGSRTTSADPDVLRGGLRVVVAAAALFWALVRHEPSGDARNGPAPKSPADASKGSSSAASLADYL